MAMKLLRMFRFLIAGLLVLPSLYAGTVFAVSPIKITLTSAKSSYLDTEPVELFLTVRNTSGADTYVTKGFMQKDFHLFLNLNGPSGNIRANELVGNPEPLGAQDTPDALGFLRPAVPCDRVPPTDTTNANTDDDGVEKLFDLKQFYPVTKTGAYSAVAETELDVYTDFVEMANGDIYCFVDDPQREAFNPLASNSVKFTIEPSVALPKSGILSSFEVLDVSPGQRPVVIKGPIYKVRVQLFDMEQIPAEFLPADFKTYALIAESDRVKPVQVRFTDREGRADFDLVPQGNYLLIGTYQTSTDTRYVGAQIAADAKEWSDASTPLKAHLKIFLLPNNNEQVKVKKKAIPGKTRRLTGSELLITQPEYIEWASDQEVYPFVFEASGDWDVVTAVTPPDGFVTDADSLEAVVVDELEAVQFTITDVGSDWTETDVTYDIDHKKKKIKIKDKIGIRLEKKLAKKKGMDIYGDTASPGDFVGGKKIKDKTTETALEDTKNKDKKTK
jgi:hypothetical protein